MTIPNPEDAPLEDVAEFADNPEDRCACVLLLDVSYSMTGTRIQQVNDGIKAFKDEVSRDPLASLRAEIAVVAFNDKVKIVQDFVTVRDFEPLVLTASGGTRIAGAINLALGMIDQRKEKYKANYIGYYRPIVLLVTDGYPEHDTEEEIAKAAKRIVEDERGRHVAFFAFGVERADMAMLAKISVRRPRHIREAQIRDIFQWLANSVDTISRSQPGERRALQEPPGDTDY